MNDKQKITEEIDELRNFLDVELHPAVSPGRWDIYSTLCDMIDELETAILDLPKKQEAKKVVESTNMYTGLPITHCPKCAVSLDRYLYGRQYEGQINYCPMCGQELKWE